MRNLALVIALAATGLVAIPSAHAQEYPWCAQYGNANAGGRNCGFTTYEQCLAAISGVGGMCEQNAFFQASAAAPAVPLDTPRKRRHRHR